MSSTHPEQDPLYDEANRLYWESDRSVNQIGEELDLSKGVLYSLIAALPANLPCPECGGGMMYPNRTARTKGFLACSDCGMEEEESAVRSFWQNDGDVSDEVGQADTRALAERAGSALHRAVNSGRDRVSSLSPRGRIIAGTALLGVAAGLALGTIFRKR